MSAKNPRITWGSECWAECVCLTDAKRASTNPYRNWLFNSKLYHGQVFGRDEKGMFILRNIVREQRSGHGYEAEIMLYRLDMNHGWVQTWENNSTTKWAMYLFRNNNKRRTTTTENKLAPRASLAQVRGMKVFQPVN